MVELPFEQLESQIEKERERGLQGYSAAIYTLSQLHRSLRLFPQPTIKAGTKRTFNRAHSYQSARLKAGFGVMLSPFTHFLIVVFFSKADTHREQKPRVPLAIQDTSYPSSSHNHIRSCSRLTFKLQRVKGFLLWYLQKHKHNVCIGSLHGLHVCVVELCLVQGKHQFIRVIACECKLPAPPRCQRR